MQFCMWQWGAYHVNDFCELHRDLGALQVAVVAGVVNKL